MEQVNGIRLQEFRQVKKEIRGSTEHLIVGLDIAKERHNAFFGTATGKTLHKAECSLTIPMMVFRSF